MRTPKEILLTVIISIITSISLVAQDCTTGDCKEDYGFYSNPEKGLYHGFYKSGNYNGIGYNQTVQGTYYFSEFKDGKPNGYTVYNETGNTTGGMFVNGVKEGVHIEFPVIPNTVKRIAITYEKGKELNRETLTAAKPGANPCIAGDCENGFGIKFDGSMLVSAVWEFGDMVHGQVVNVREGVEKIFMAPDMENAQANYFMYENVPVQEGKLEVASMYKAGQPDGQYIVLNLAAGQMGAAIMKEGETVKKYDVK